MSRDDDEIRCPMAVCLGLGRTAERPECWILDNRPLETLDDFVRTHHDTLVERLEFAFLELAGSFRVILRSCQSADGPPTLPFHTGRYVSLLRLPNVFVPCDSRLTPLLRRDFLRDWLVRKHEFTWLEPDGPRRFHVHRAAREAFRPLTEWVTYVCPKPNFHKQMELSGSLFQNEVFAVRSEPKESPTLSTKKRPGREDNSVYVEPPKNMPAVVKGVAPPKENVLPPLEVPPETEIPAPEQVVAHLRLLENRFRNSTLPLDSAYRQEWWAGLARQNRLAQLDEEADRCWSFAVWEEEAKGIWMPSWAHNHSAIRKQTLLAICHRKEPTADDLRTLAVALIHAASRPKPAFPPDVIPAIATTLEEHDVRMPVRLAWLAWESLSKLAGNDVLALSRARDRVLRDLMEYGLRKDRDFPLFLQSKNGRKDPAEESDSHLFLRLREKAWSWCSQSQMNELASVFRTWVDLTFASALARFGDTGVARTILDDSTKRWEAKVASLATPAQEWLFQAYQERVRQACRGENAQTPLPPALRRELGSLAKSERESAERYLQFSRILEPFERIDPYRNSRPVGDHLQATLNEISSLTPTANKKRRAENYAEELETRFRELFKISHSPRQVLRILMVAMPLATRIGESFALECHSLLEKTLPRADRPMDVQEIAKRVELIETAAVTVAHFGRTNLIAGLLEELRKMIRTQKGELGALFARATGGGSYRFMARVGLQEQAKELLDETATACMSDQTIAEVMSRPALNRGVFVPAFAKLAAGWFYFGQTEQAKEVIQVVREELFNGQMMHESRTALAASYAFALGLAPRQLAIAHYEELFSNLELTRISFDSMAVQRLTVIEAVVLSLSSDDFSSDEQTRRWMDEDEFLVRRRIHRDVEVARKLAGL
ncbi:hypothetical protein [Zavarzinella formosa]|uniref:hypothetical protein n=1 Tax=Zavarzinella formosa TaxID=360055 RepID=UPI000495D9C1|nr:hypothetical protein [Zavarzinella formosa]